MKCALHKICCCLSAIVLLGCRPFSVSAQTDFDKEADQIIYLVNLQRISVGASPLMTTPYLHQLASTRANELTIKYGHTRPDGTSCFTIFDDADFYYNACAENVAWATFNSAEQVVDGWLNSPMGHRENMLNTKYNYTGVGVAQDSSGKTYWSQLFVSATGIEGGYIPEDPTVVKLTGDADGDGIVNVTDVALILADCAKIAVGETPSMTSEQMESCDINQDGFCNSIDASYILQYASYLGAGGSESIIDWYALTSK